MELKAAQTSVARSLLYLCIYSITSVAVPIVGTLGFKFYTLQEVEFKACLNICMFLFLESIIIWAVVNNKKKILKSFHPYQWGFSKQMLAAEHRSTTLKLTSSLWSCLCSSRKGNSRPVLQYIAAHQVVASFANVLTQSTFNIFIIFPLSWCQVV